MKKKPPKLMEGVCWESKLYDACKAQHDASCPGECEWCSPSEIDENEAICKEISDKYAAPLGCSLHLDRWGYTLYKGEKRLFAFDSWEGARDFCIAFEILFEEKQ